VWPFIAPRLFRNVALPASSASGTRCTRLQILKDSLKNMILQNIYYAIKPFLPWSVRIFLRRQRARSRKSSFCNVWPIDPIAATAPPNWPGWPNGKRFAVVLTHDVEGPKGLGRTLQLMEAESRHGFRSSFNFVPKGDYRVDALLRSTLDSAGFEVGVHGLEHDGKLYKSKADFVQKATQIREYMRKWNATGFRSPLMQHKLGWLHQLGVEYDASTFDTDPFEPQSDGVRTIFPFWVPSQQGSGYVELPYTLVQDFTLFTILGQTNTDVWKAKVDWIAAHGGMVLLNTHPDYICFEGTPQRDEYPLSYYEEFLTHLRAKYNNQFWSALPREVAAFYRSTSSTELRNTRRRVCIVTYGKGEADNRLRHYAEALVKNGDHVEVIVVGAENGSPPTEIVSGMAIWRIRQRRSHGTNKWIYALHLLQHLCILSVRLTLRHSRIQYDLIHFCDVPNCLVFSAWHPKRRGAKLLLDLRDTTAKDTTNELQSGLKIYAKCLRAIETASANFVDHIITSKELSHGRPTLSFPKEKCTVLRGCPDEDTNSVGSQRESSSLRFDETLVRILASDDDDHAMTDVVIDISDDLGDRDHVLTRGREQIGDAVERRRRGYLDIVTSLLVERF